MLPNENVYVRNFEVCDIEATSNVFFRAVHIGAKNFYDEAQRAAWATNKPEPAAWQKRLEAQVVKVALQEDVVVGFMTLTPEGRIDLVFVAPEVMGTGVTGKLHEAILAEARLMGLSTLMTEASFLAQRFFNKHGWQTLQKQTITRNAVQLTNFLMELNLSETAAKSGNDH